MADSSELAAILRDIQGDMERTFHTQAGIDTLSKILASSDPLHTIYSDGVRRLRRLCRDTKLVPTSCTIQTPIVNISEKPISRTAFSDIWTGTLNGRKVAIKALRLHEDEYEKVKKAYVHELVVWQCLRHRNIVPFIGTAREFDISLVSEWMPGGTVAAFLLDHPDHDRVALVVDIVDGLTFIHSLDVVHGDVKSTNVLVDGAGAARITDFGLAVMTLATMTSTTSTTGSLRWMAPELLDPEKFSREIATDDLGKPTQKSDIYALAITAWEIFSGEVPFAKLRDAQVIKNVLDGTRPPRRPEFASMGLSDTIWIRMRNWWSPSPAARSSLHIRYKKSSNTNSPRTSLSRPSPSARHMTWPPSSSRTSPANPPLELQNHEEVTAKWVESRLFDKMSTSLTNAAAYPSSPVFRQILGNEDQTSGSGPAEQSDTEEDHRGLPIDGQDHGSFRAREVQDADSGSVAQKDSHSVRQSESKTHIVGFDGDPRIISDDEVMGEGSTTIWTPSVEWRQSDRSLAPRILSGFSIKTSPAPPAMSSSEPSF